MTRWLGVDAVTAPLRKLVAQVPKGATVRDAAAAVVSAHYGHLAFEQPALINIGVLAVLARGLPSTYLVRPSASRVVHETDLHSIPTEPPLVLRAPGIVEVRRPETGERLWGDVASLGWYVIDGAEMEPPRLVPAIYLIGICYPDGIYVARWSPEWTGEDLEVELPYQDAPDQSPLVRYVDKAVHQEFARQAARYLTVFGLLAQVEGGPLRFDLDKRERERKLQHVRIVEGARKPPAPRLSPQEPLPDERVLGDTKVRGHLKRVRIGEGRKKIAWIYVDGYSARRWFAPRWTVERDHKHTGLANQTLVYRGEKRG